MAEAKGKAPEDVYRTEPWQRPDISRRGHRLRMALARVTLALGGLDEHDRLLTLNAALEDVLYPDRSVGR